MLRAHSLLWHYLFVAPNVLLLILAVVMWRRKLQKRYPVFLVFAVVSAVEQLTVYAADVIPSVTAETFWRVLSAGFLAEALVKFALIGEIFSALFGLYPSVAKLGKLLISGVGAVLVLVATVAAAYTEKASTFASIAGAHLLEQTIYMIECGLIVFLFVFAFYFKLSWNRSSFGIALGLGISACVDLAIWALAANGSFSARYHVFLDSHHGFLDFPIMFAYHVSVMIWFYYLLVPQKKTPSKPAAPPPEHKLEVWNAELERLLHQ